MIVPTTKRQTSRVVCDDMLDLDLPGVARELLTMHGATRTGPRADAETLSAVLAKLGFAVHASVIAFESSYGGLRIEESTLHAASLDVGPFMLHDGSSPYRIRDPQLVPVMATSNDVVYSLDARGHGYATSTMVDGRQRPLARSGKQLLTQAILWCALDRLPNSYDHLEGGQGEARAKDAGLARIAAASTKHETWWGGPRRLIVQIEYGNGYDGPVTYVGR